ncbi:hypothetical protein [Ruegeria arenilitoris]|uniref:hypothetical protein n=1 Tax=Ruegeria arenilitoris TaxID=1173585 RepID=UPI00147D03F7|nr:hypothetical protein [Ruegeria arenilitoris]
MLKKLKRVGSPLLLLLLAACSGLTKCGGPKPIDKSEFESLYNTPAPAPSDLQRVFHIGHSLVGRDMPEMLAQLAGEGHGYNSQQGWGTALKAHWEEDETIYGFEKENDHPRYRDAHEAVSSGEYNALVVTEMVEIRDAIKYMDSADYLHRWAKAGWEANPELRVYLYETWHELTDEEGWLQRLDLDLERYWETEILRRALAYENMQHPIYVIPAGQVFARFVREVDESNGIGPVNGKEDLFAKTEDGEQDNIHFNDLGAYLVALTHYAVLYQKSPIGLPYELKRADGSDADSPGPDAARVMQKIVWDVVTNYAPTGVPPQ